MSSENGTASCTNRYEKKREAIVAAAAEILSKKGLKGMTLTEVAAAVSLNTTSITYYFRKKEELAAACYVANFERMRDVVLEASAHEAAAGRLSALFKAMFQRHEERRAGKGPPLLPFVEIRALDDKHKSAVMAVFSEVIYAVRALLQSSERPFTIHELRARAFLVIEQLFWCRIWLSQIDVEDYPRAHARLMDIILNGFSAHREAWPPSKIDIEALNEPVNEDNARDMFLRAATRLINRLGYRSASVEKISAEVNVTKGSFYHHNEAKDELVLACFERSNEAQQRITRAAINHNGDGFAVLAAANMGLAEYQNSTRGPLLEPLALIGAPPALKMEVWARALRSTERVAGIISDGIADGSVRSVDPAIGANTLVAALNASATAKRWIREEDGADVIELLTKPALLGLFAD